MLKKLKWKFRQVYYDNEKLVLTETFYMNGNTDKDMGDVIDIFDRFGLKVLDMRYLSPAIHTNYKAAIQFDVCGKTKNARMYEDYMNRHYKPFKGPDVLNYEPGVELT